MVRVSGQVDNPDRPPPGTRPRLAVAGVECRRGERPLFAPLGFSVAAGGVVWLRGANGRGKTTLLRTLAGLSAADAGTIEWGDSPAGATPFLFLGHGNGLKDDLAVDEALRFALALDAIGGDAESARDGDAGRSIADDRTGDAGSDPVAAALARLGLLDRRRAPLRTLSQGQRRRVALARLAAAAARDREPRVWLLDEPFDALDAAGVATLNALLAEHAGRGGATVLSSHLELTLAAPRPVAIDLVEPLPASAAASDAAPAA